LGSKRKRLTEHDEHDDDDTDSEPCSIVSSDEDSNDEDANSLSERELAASNGSNGDPLETSDGEEEGEREESAVEDSSSDESDSEKETRAERERKTAYFDQETSASSGQQDSFLSMNLSRPILKALASLGFNKPTPIQASTIPVALLGKDVVGNAVTGSGKTAAFTIPMIERLLYREKGAKAAATRCLVLVPTRELAVQCYEVGTKLAVHTDIRFCLIVGMKTILLNVLALIPVE
jgi:ATP-dependent RNA helicase DDX27